MTIRESVGIVIEARREDLGLTQRELADKLGYTVKRMRNLEWGRGRLTANVLFELAKELKMLPSQIIELSGRVYEKHQKKKGR